MDDKISFRHIRVFLEAARLSSVSRAAESLNLTQSAVSRALAELEAVVGARLMERSRRGSHLTRVGKEFHDFLAPGVAHIRKAYSLLDPDTEASQTVSFGAVPSLMTGRMANVLTEFQTENPQVTIRVIEAHNIPLLNLLRSDEIDFAVGRLLTTDLIHGLVFEHLFDESIAWFVGSRHPLARTGTAQLGDLGRWPIVVNLPETIVRTEMGRLLASGGYDDVKDLIETNSVVMARCLTLAGQRIWLAPNGSAAADVDDGALCRLDVTGWDLVRPVGFWSNRRVLLSRKSQQLMNAIRAAAQQVT